MVQLPQLRRRRVYDEVHELAVLLQLLLVPWVCLCILLGELADLRVVQLRVRAEKQVPAVQARRERRRATRQELQPVPLQLQLPS